MRVTEAAENQYDNDQWDQIDTDTYWQPLPATTVNEYLSGETDIIYVRRDDDGRWWVSVTNEIGASDYEKLEEAKAAGDDVIAQYYADQLADIAADLGVSPDEWEVSLDGEFIEVKSKIDDSVEIYGSDGRWNFNGVVNAHSSDFQKILEIASREIKSSPAPR